MSAPRPPKPFAVDQLKARVLIGRGLKRDQWYWQVRRGTTGIFSGRMTREECMRRMVEAATEQVAPEVERGPETIEGMLQLWLGSWVDHLPGDQASTAAVYDVASRRLISGMGSVVVERVTRQTLLDYAAGARQRGYAAETIRKDLATLTSAWRWAAELGLAPATMPRKPDVKGPRIYNGRTPTWAEIYAVIDHFGDHPIAHGLTLAAATGARISAACLIRRCDVESIEGEDGGTPETDTRLAWVWLLFTKKRIPRRVPIRRDAAGLVARLLAMPGEPEERLLRHVTDWRHLPAGRPVGPMWGKTIAVRLNPDRLDWSEIRVDGKPVEPFTPHGIRRKVGDTLRDADVPLEVAAAQLGHRPEVFLRRYRAEQTHALLAAGERVDLGARDRAPRVVPLKRRG